MTSNASQTHFNADEAGARLQAQGGCQYGPVEDLKNPAPLVLAPAPHAGPQRWKHAGQTGQAAKDSAGKSDCRIRHTAAKA
jgi:hypothetical protein